MNRWLVKVRRYGGGTSVVTDYDDKDKAEAKADDWNRQYQTDACYVEENVNSELAHIERMRAMGLSAHSTEGDEGEFAEGTSDALATFNRVATELGLSQKEMFIATGIRKRTFHSWKGKSPAARPRLSSVGELWALADTVEELSSIVNRPLAAWLNSSTDRRTALLEHRWSALIDAALQIPERAKRELGDVPHAGVGNDAEVPIVRTGGQHRMSDMSRDHEARKAAWKDWYESRREGDPPTIASAFGVGWASAKEFYALPGAGSAFVALRQLHTREPAAVGEWCQECRGEAIVNVSAPLEGVWPCPTIELLDRILGGRPTDLSPTEEQA